MKGNGLHAVACPREYNYVQGRLDSTVTLELILSKHFSHDGELAVSVRYAACKPLPPFWNFSLARELHTDSE